MLWYIKILPMAISKYVISCYVCVINTDHIKKQNGTGKHFATPWQACWNVTVLLRQIYLTKRTSGQKTSKSRFWALQVSSDVNSEKVHPKQGLLYISSSKFLETSKDLVLHPGIWNDYILYVAKTKRELYTYISTLQNESYSQHTHPHYRWPLKEKKGKSWRIWKG